MNITFSENDIRDIESRGLTLADIHNQIQQFREGFPFLEIKSTATIQHGINKIDTISSNTYISDWEKYLNSGKTVIKFVPASGAASRMFKDLFEFLDSNEDTPNSKFVLDFFKNITQYAFYDDLNKAVQGKFNKNIESLITEGKYKDIVSTLLTTTGLNYGGLPKGLLKFHKYPKGTRTPIEEHMVEGALYAKINNNLVNIHFTVSPEHHRLFSNLINDVRDGYEKELDAKFSISFSEQKAKTDTIAVNPDNTPFKENDHLVFRPGGHGALLENLNDLDADILFVKNIDNTVPDKYKKEEVLYKKILAGYLVSIQEKVHNYLLIINSGDYDRKILLEILYFLQDTLNVKNPETKYLEDAELVLYLKNKLNRPIRVCGMVPNIGEPGGGPFFTVNEDGTISLQILESSQIDLNNPSKKEMFETGTHFNPVDIVCAVKDYQGNKFNLMEFVDKKTGFISNKSKNGKELKALELPGLWNGSMSDWNTVFVEVPLSTFNPVKTVNDLLRKEHQ